MKTILFIILCVFSVFSTNIYAQAVPAETPCGLSLQGEGNTLIANEDSTICQQDLSQNVLYLMYGNILDSEIGKNLFFLFDPNENINKLSFEVGVSALIKNVLMSFNNLMYTLIMLYLIFYTIKYIYISQSAGKGISDNKGKPAAVVFILIGVIFLCVPVDGIMIAQYAILFVAMIAIALANYMYSSFLHAVEIKTTQFPVDSVQLRTQSASTSENLISGALCETRTTQQLLNFGFHANQAFDDDDDGEMLDIGEKVKECMSYYVRPETNAEGSMNGFTVHRPSLKYCFEEITSIKCGEKSCDDTNIFKRWFGSLTNHEYYEDVYGNSHTCATANYNVPLYTEKFLGQDGMIDSIKQAWIHEDDVIDTVEDLKQKWATDQKFSVISGQISGVIENLLNTPIKERVVKEMEFQNFLDQMAEQLSTQIYLDIGNDERIWSQNGKFKADAINAKALGIVNSMLGLSGKDDTEFRLDGKEDHEYGIQILRTEAKKAADLIEQAHCSASFRDLLQSQQTAITANALVENGSDEDAVEHYQKKLGVNGFNFECVKFTGTELGDDTAKEDYEFYYNAKNDKQSVNAQLDVSNGSYGLEFEIKELSFEQKAKILADFDMNYIIKVKQAYRIKLTLEGYAYIARKATLIALQKALKQNNDNELLIEQRQRGWTGSASLLISLSSFGGNAAMYADTIKSTANIASSVDSSADSNFVNELALTRLSLQEQEVEKPLEVPILKELKITGFFNTLGNVKFNEKQPFVNKGNEEHQQSNMIIVYIQKLILSPFDYLKQTSGFSQSGTIGDGLENCRKGTGRCIGDDNPISGLMQTGHGLIEQAITLMMLRVAVKAIVENIDPDDSKTDGKSTSPANAFKKVLTKVAPVLSVGVFVLKVVSVILETLSPLFTLMLTMGIFLAYIAPTLVFFYFTTIVLGWLLHIFMKLFTAPIWIVFLSIFDSAGNSRMKLDAAWQHIGGILLKPVLTVIAVVFSFTFTSVGLYFVNVAFGSWMQTLNTQTQGDIVVGLVGAVVMLSLYIAVVVFICLYAFKVIHILPDYILETLNVRGSGDTNMVQSMQVQKILETYGAYKLSSSMEQVGNKVSRNMEAQKAERLQNKRYQWLDEYNTDKAERLKKSQERDIERDLKIARENSKDIKTMFDKPTDEDKTP